MLSNLLFKSLIIFICSLQNSFATNLELLDGQTLKNVKPIVGELTELDASIMEIVVGKSTLLDVQKKIGEGDISESGGGPNRVSYLCYKDTKRNILSFESSGPMAGNSRMITTVFLVSSKEKYIFQKDCKLSNKDFSSIEIAGVALNKDKDAVVKIKGEPSYSSAKQIVYLYKKPKDTKDKSGLDNTHIIEFKISKNKVGVISLTRFSSY